MPNDQDRAHEEKMRQLREENERLARQKRQEEETLR